MILFLDFNGAAHPEFYNYDDYFCKRNSSKKFTPIRVNPVREEGRLLRY